MQSWVRLLALTTALLALLLLTWLVPAAQAQEVVDEPAAEEVAEVDETEPGGEEEGEEEKEDSELESWAGIEEITVTANKREQALQDVPISMAALQSDFIEDAGITEFGQIQQFVPNLKIDPSTDARSTTVRIRGIGSIGNNAGVDPSVGVFIDGVYQGRAGMSVGDLLDIDRVEVLRGPQGTLYGKNTAAGAINILTKRPIYDVESMAEVFVGDYKNLQFRGSINVPLLNDRVAARVSGYRVVRDGFDTNRFNGADVNDGDKWGLRGRFLFDVTPNLEILVSGDYSYEDTKCCVADIITYKGETPLKSLGFNTTELTWLHENPDWPGNAPPMSQEEWEERFGHLGPYPPAWVEPRQSYEEHIENIDDKYGVDPFDREVGANDHPKNKIAIGGVSLNAELSLGDAMLSSLSAYRYYSSDSLFDGDFSEMNIENWDTLVDLDQFSQEFQYVSPSGERVEYQGGLYFYFQNMDTLSRLTIHEEVEGLINYNTLLGAYNDDTNLHRTYSLAAYGQGTYHFNDQWSLTGGLRLTWEKKTRVGSQISEQAFDPENPDHGCPEDGGNPGQPMDTPPISGPDQFLDNDKDWTNLSGMVSLRYFPMEGVMVYASYSRGFKSGGFNQIRTPEAQRLINDNTKFEPEYSTNLELGSKTSWFDRRLTLNGTFFYTWYSDFQAQSYDGASILILNAGSMRSYGVEADAVGMPLPDWIISVSMGFNIAEYKFFPDAENTVSNILEICDGNMLFCTKDFSQDLSGEAINGAPKWNISAYSQYERLLPIPGVSILWKIQAEYSYTSPVNLAMDLDPHLDQDAVNLLNLRAGLRAEDDLWSVMFEVTNVTDEHWNVVGFDVPIVGGFAGINGPPRQYGVRFRLKY